MLSLPSSIRIYLSRRAVDFRKAFDGLCAIVQHEFGRDPFTGDMFVFFNRRRDRVKILLWDANGFWMYYKRLERGRFEAWWPETKTDDHTVIDRSRLTMLLEGIDAKKARYRYRFARSVCIGNRRAHGRDDSRAGAP